MLQQKGCILMYPLDNGTSGYIWRPEWVLPYESLWNIVEKFRYINCLDSLRIPLLKLSHRTITDGTPYDAYNYIFPGTLSYKDDELPQYFGMNDTHFSVMEVLSDNKLSLYMDEKIKVCPGCICMGYHSFLHQLSFMDKCFVHDKVSLITTEIPYSLNYINQFNYGDICNFHHSIDLLDILTKKERIFKGRLVKNDRLANYIKIIIPEYPYAKVDSSSIKNANDYLYNAFWNNGKHHCLFNPIWKLSKKSAEEKWGTDYSNSVFDIYSDSFSNYCHVFSNKLKNECDSYTMEQTLISFNSSYTGRYYDEEYCYDYDCIAAILTSAILTGYSDYDVIGQIYSKHWTLYRNKPCFCEDQFSRLIKRTKIKYHKTAYVELYKILVEDLYEDILKRAHEGEYSQKDHTQMANSPIMVSMYILVETNENIKILKV